MKPHVKTTLGIDIGPHQVSAALVERAGQDFRVIAAASSDLPDVKTPQDSARQAKALSRVIRKLGRRARSPHVKAALSLSASPMLIQILDMPKHMPANIRDFVANELKQYVALSGKRTLSDFCGIGPSADGQKRMLAVAIETEQAQVAANTCAKAGVTIDAIEPSLLAYARAFHAGHPQDKCSRNVLIALLSGGNLAVCLFCKGVLDFVRVRDIPSDTRDGDSLCRWLSEELKAVIRYQNAGDAGLAALHARVVVQKPGLSAREMEPVLLAITGMDGLVVTDSREPFSGPATAGDVKPDDVVSLMAVGAAMKASDPDADDLKINLLPEEVRHARLLTRHALLTAIAAACTFLGMLVAIFLLSRTAGSAHEQVEQTKIDKQLYTTRALIAEDKFLDQEMSRVQQQLKPLEKLLHAQHAVDWPAVLNAVRQAALAGVCVTEMSNDSKDRLSLKGLALSCETAQSFARGLDGNKTFLSASMVRVARQQGAKGLMEYQIDCSLKPARVEK
jgi:Tfp pilus assembly protein PilN